MANTCTSESTPTAVNPTTCRHTRETLGLGFTHEAIHGAGQADHLGGDQVELLLGQASVATGELPRYSGEGLGKSFEVCAAAGRPPDRGARHAARFGWDAHLNPMCAAPLTGDQPCRPWETMGPADYAQCPARPGRLHL